MVLTDVGRLLTLLKVAQSQGEAPPKEKLEGLSGKQQNPTPTPAISISQP